MSKTIFGGHIEWHEPNEKRIYGKPVVTAFTYNRNGAYSSLADSLHIGDSCFLDINDPDVKIIAWAYVPTGAASKLLDDYIKERDEYEKVHADKIKAARIAELEKELAELKGENA